ncbi:beta-N-acetylglucosaminidase domain-containing protein [Acaryochloris sp. IP29b_bin.148]|uniref:beta-N-acetylglucosaminidase domain-containing protein n=1 Tax=Acaryochloris sp. IP29b_bin.148 TaxID=2969218 RepID=UPI0026143CF2|nr:beta-N-acetylglucosaminidase domain-containing protein [Acaryochloris sp. IP29b_bin.148]
MNVDQQWGYGVIEGFFGQPWTWQARLDYANFLKANGFQFYIYAPKADPYLRIRWQELWPEATFAELKRLGERYRQVGLAWGIGINLFEIFFHYDQQTIQQLTAKIRYLNQFQPDILAILFDDMRGDCDRIAPVQAEITHRITELSTAQTFIMCPTYYSSSQVLDQLFGQRPPHYLETLGKSIDPQVHIFWTGPEICSSSYPLEHLQEVSQKLGRKPFIWDNYPVNDSANMCNHLHLRAFENRPYQMAEWISGHAANPMNQPYLSQIPLKTLHLSYQQQAQYCPQQALREAAKSLCSQDLADMLMNDLSLFQDQGLEQLSPEHKGELITKYQLMATEYSQEIIRWLQGDYPFSPDCLTV